jgi:transposase
MAAYSLDLQKRVLRAWDSGMDVYSVAAKYEVSRAWVHRLVQRRRETGPIEPRKQTKFRRRSLSPLRRASGRADHGAAGCDARGIEAALPTTAALNTLWRTIGRFGFTVKKNRIRRRTAAS